MARLFVTFVATALVASSSASMLAPTAHPTSAAAKVLALRGGAVSGVSLCAAAPTATSSRSKKAAIVLGVNAFVSTAYGILGTCQPNAMLAIFGVTETIAFMSPAFGVAQYLGGMHLAVALRCFGALGVPGLPERPAQEALQEMCALHTIAGVVAGIRQLKGSSSPVAGSILMAGLAYWASKE